jgi:hypothetical protein
VNCVVAHFNHCGNVEHVETHAWHGAMLCYTGSSGAVTEWPTKLCKQRLLALSYRQQAPAGHSGNINSARLSRCTEFGCWMGRRARSWSRRCPAPSVAGLPAASLFAGIPGCPQQRMASAAAPAAGGAAAPCQPACLAAGAAAAPRGRLYGPARLPVSAPARPAEHSAAQSAPRARDDGKEHDGAGALHVPANVPVVLGCRCFCKGSLG